MTFPINLLFIAFFISVFPAYIFHGQSFVSSMKAYMIFYVFLLYFILFRLQFTYNEIVKICLSLFFISLFIYLIDYLTLPDALFSSQNPFERRGTVTIRFSGQGFTFLGTFYFLSRFCRNGKIVHFILYILGFCFLILFSGSRIQFLSVVLNTFFVIYFYRKEIKRYFLYIIPLLAISIVTGIYLLESYVAGLYKLAIEELSTFETNIRYEAARYFTTDFQSNLVTKILGNGYPATGEYGDLFQVVTNYGFWTADLGLIGFWVYFGIIGVIAWLIIFKRIFFWETDHRNIFVKAYFLNLLLTIVLGYAIFSPGYMITTVLCMFLFDKNKQDRLLSKEKTS